MAQDPDATRERYEGDTQERSWDAKVNATYEDWREDSRVLFSNLKRTYDEYQQESLETIKQQRTLFTKILTDAQQFDNARQIIANQALQNAVETANMVSKQTVRHADFAVDQQWNLEPHEAAAEAEVLPKFYLDAIKSIVVATLTEMGVTKET
jgi:hypothetical protein